jgi:hypothetical protein
VPPRKVRVPPTSEAVDLQRASDDTDRLVRIGVVIFGVGLLCVVAAVVPLFFGVHNLATALNLAAGLLPPLGLGIALLALFQEARRQRRARQSGQMSR